MTIPPANQIPTFPPYGFIFAGTFGNVAIQRTVDTIITEDGQPIVTEDGKYIGTEEKIT